MNEIFVVFNIKSALHQTKRLENHTMPIVLFSSRTTSVVRSMILPI